MTVPWFDGSQPGDVPSVAPAGLGVGLSLPGRASDCTGRHPSWYPFAVNVCDLDDPDPAPLTARELSAGFGTP